MSIGEVTGEARPTRTFTLPDLGEGLTEAEITDWRVAVGDTVEVDQVVVEVETAKATVELPCPHAGVVAELHGDVGDVLDVGRPLLSVAAVAPPAVEAGGPARPAERATAAHEADDSGAVLVGYGTSGAQPRRRRRARLAPAEHPPVAAGRGVVAVVSPLVRRMARDSGIDLASLRGSGPGGLITRRDVVAATTAPPAPSAPDTTARGEERAEPPSPDRVPLRGRSRAMAEQVTRAHREIPAATTWVDVDATELMAVRETLRGGHPRGATGSPIGVLALLARICVAALGRFPELNGRVDVERGELLRLPAVHLGFAAQTDRGLLVPVVRDAHRRTTEELAVELTRLTEAARADRLTPHELTGSTFTLNNYGVYGVDGSTPIINHPEVAMLGVGRIAARPWVHGEELAVRQVTQLSLTFDHRACDGGVAGGFLRFVADCVEAPARLLRTM